MTTAAWPSRRCSIPTTWSARSRPSTAGTQRRRARRSPPRSPSRPTAVRPSPPGMPTPSPRWSPTTSCAWTTVRSGGASATGRRSWPPSPPARTRWAEACGSAGRCDRGPASCSRPTRSGPTPTSSRSGSRWRRCGTTGATAWRSSPRTTGRRRRPGSRSCRRLPRRRTRAVAATGSSCACWMAEGADAVRPVLAEDYRFVDHRLGHGQRHRGHRRHRRQPPQTSTRCARTTSSGCSRSLAQRGDRLALIDRGVDERPVDDPGHLDVVEVDDDGRLAHRRHLRHGRPRGRRRRAGPALRRRGGRAVRGRGGRLRRRLEGDRRR